MSTMSSTTRRGDDDIDTSIDDDGNISTPSLVTRSTTRDDARRHARIIHPAIDRSNSIRDRVSHHRIIHHS
jgi:hypothetical protein